MYRFFRDCACCDTGYDADLGSTLAPQQIGQPATASGVRDFRVFVCDGKARGLNVWERCRGAF